MDISNEGISNKHILKASFWSFAAEIVSKIASPLIFLIMTRLLAPEDFGLVAIATTILGFVNIINDLGTSKIIIQESGDDAYIDRLNNVAFWFNLTMGALLTSIVFIFSKNLALFCGKVSATDIIRVMSIQILFFSFSSVQNANKCKFLEYKSLFIIRLFTVLLPGLISIPFAFMGFGFWALVFGQISGSAANTFMLWFTSSWRPKFSLDLPLLWKVLAKSFWSTLESVMMWVPVILDTYLITHYLSTRSLGLYTTSRGLYTLVTGLLLAPILPVLFSTLSLIKGDSLRFTKFILFAQKIVFAVSMFIGVGAYIFQQPIGNIIFNKKWEGIAGILGVVFLVFGFEYFSSVIMEAYRAKGKFLLLALNQSMYVIIAIPLLFFITPHGLTAYVWARSLLLLALFPVYLIFSEREFGIKPMEYIKNTADIMIISLLILMAAFAINLIIKAYISKYLLLLLMYILSIAAYVYFNRNNFWQLFEIIKKNKDLFSK